eukprot:MONOS_7389.1-p1 / transcript=MONOS_7389.1 / gene=MONOS_7389 / organism=Monocercomonoides_exilis_PA203 / gene_product=splicing factor U2AF 35 kDa subunit / transcript_product=splicing factor U2AF 35 kDa subunit / location=Mono_scaffold00251:34213-34994(+) / protein_length=168 / sequence_SO=supercontig / SO=protein_coding / is_pseudo=false
MARELAQTYGTEQDRVHCPFYFKMGACRYGDSCSRKHIKPEFSQTVLLAHMYPNPIAFEGSASFSKEVLQQHFEEFYEDVFEGLSKFGKIEEMYVVDNICEHLFGNVYVKFEDEDSAARCVEGLKDRTYAGKPVSAELSPVTDFKDARCRQFETEGCTRSGQCNFMHL